MISYTVPDYPSIMLFIEEQARKNFTYSPLKGTASDENVPDFDNDILKDKIGFGSSDFDMAKEAIRQWQMFPLSWTRILPHHAPIKENITIAMYAHFAGIWWRNACKIVYVIDEPSRFGFAYGTLPGHIERGEELFLVEKDASGNVFYTIKAFSKPHHILAKMAYPIMRRLQDKFRSDSLAQMRGFIQKQH